MENPKEIDTHRSGVDREAGVRVAQGNKHYLVTVLGKEPQPRLYEYGGNNVEERLAPLALLRLLPPERQPDEVLAICTAEAKASAWPLLENGTQAGHIAVRSVDITDRELKVPADFLECVAGAIPLDARQLSVDVTHGFRHLPLLTYLAVQYVAALRQIELGNAFYAMDEPDLAGAPTGAVVMPKQSRLLDLTAVFDFPAWIRAVQAFDADGNAHWLAECIDDGSQEHRRRANELRSAGQARKMGLPLELGCLAARIRENGKSLRRTLRESGALLSKEAAEAIQHSLEPFALAASPKTGASKREWVELGAPELERQARVIDDLLKRGEVQPALGLMNEWIVSCFAYRTRPGEDWLDYHKVRRRVASSLAALAEIAKEDRALVELNEEQKRLAEFWRDVANLRNSFSHHGMRADVLIGPSAAKVESNFERVRAAWSDEFRSLPQMQVELPGGSIERLLVSALGESKGVLYSAIHATRKRWGADPTACLIICSEGSQQYAAEALDAADFSGERYELVVADPYGGVDALGDVRRQARRYLIDSASICANLTGGTTFMGLIVDAIVEDADRLARDVRRFGLIDTRPSAVQRADPYHAADAFWLDGSDERDY